jgi:hypothetical protein
MPAVLRLLGVAEWSSPRPSASEERFKRKRAVLPLGIARLQNLFSLQLLGLPLG